MLLNWWLESAKFRLLMHKKISRLKSYFTVFGGTTVSNFTPARTGEYIGRTILLKKLKAVKVIMATVTGNVVQMLMTYFFGVLFALFFWISYKQTPWISEYKLKFFLVGFALLLFLGVLILFPKWYKRYKKSFPTPVNKAIRIVLNYPKRLLIKVTSLAFLRYSCFSIQFYLLLLVFSDFELLWSHALLVPIAYLLQSLVPVPAVGDVGVRVFVTNLLFGTVLSSEAILLAVSALWFINLIVPGIIGAFYLIYSLFADS